jgi:hypothetical protein
MARWRPRTLRPSGTPSFDDAVAYTCPSRWGDSKSYTVDEASTGLPVHLTGPFNKIADVGQALSLWPDDPNYGDPAWKAGMYTPTIVSTAGGFTGDATLRFACRGFNTTGGWVGNMDFQDGVAHVHYPAPPPPPPTSCGVFVESSQFIFEDTYTVPTGGGGCTGGTGGTFGNGLTCDSEYLILEENDGNGWYEIWEGWATVCS